eukprot:312832_1
MMQTMLILLAISTSLITPSYGLSHIINDNNWNRTQCGPADQITQFGKKVNPSSVLPEYPRPTMTRGNTSINSSNWLNLNGLWQFEGSSKSNKINPNTNLTKIILVPFPTESCLSGIGQTYKYLQYRTYFDDFKSRNKANTRVLLHFDAVDWNTRAVYINNQNVGNHIGGYTRFTFDITNEMQETDNNLYVNVFDPSDNGAQPEGKQCIQCITNPKGDRYTPSSGIWQTVWLEYVPKTYITKYKIQNNDLNSILINITINGDLKQDTVIFNIFDSNGKQVTTKQGTTNQLINITIPNAKQWSPHTPNLYNIQIKLDSGDEVIGYFGLRTIKLKSYQHPEIVAIPPTENLYFPQGGFMPFQPFNCNNYNECWKQCNDSSICIAWQFEKAGCNGNKNAQCYLIGDISYSDNTSSTAKCYIAGIKGYNAYKSMRPVFNNETFLMVGWLDQQFWPDGLYTPPSDDALLFDLQAVLDYGLNTVRFHQKVAPERWYYYADKMGIIIQQDAVQKLHGANASTVNLFLKDFELEIEQLYNHPSIIQWEIFNENDCWKVFPNITQVYEYVRSLDGTRLIDVDSGGKNQNSPQILNETDIGDVMDWHHYSWPVKVYPTDSQYGEQGEYGGIGYFVNGHEWLKNGCKRNPEVDTAQEYADMYINMTKWIIENTKYDISAVIYTQLSDIETECDGYFNYDRTAKFNEAQKQAIYKANQDLIASVW